MLASGDRDMMNTEEEKVTGTALELPLERDVNLS